MAQTTPIGQTEGGNCDMESTNGVLVCVKDGPKVLFVDLDGNSSIGELFKSPKLKNCDLFLGDYVIEGTKAPIRKIARFDQGYLVVDACHSTNPSLRGAMCASMYNPRMKCKIGLKGAFAKWLCHEKDGRIVCNRGHCLQWEHFWSIPVANDKVALLTWQHKYLSARSNGTVSVVGHSKAWEWFTVVHNNDGTVAFRSHHNKYLSVLEDGSVCMAAKADANTAFEVKLVHAAVKDEKEQKVDQVLAVPFGVERIKVSLQSHHGKFVCAEPDGRALCNREHCAEWEQFVSVPMGNGKVGLQTAHGKYISAEPSGKVISNRGWCKSWEHFQVVPARHGKVGLRSAHGKYLSAQPNGSLQCNRDALREWEEFKVAQC